MSIIQKIIVAYSEISFFQEVITNEHVVAMMKAAISETEDMPMFVSNYHHSFNVLRVGCL